MTTVFDLMADNLDLYFKRQAASISPQAREGLPPDVIKKIRLNRLSFLGKLFVLWRCLRKRIFIVIEDEEGGLTPEQFADLRKAIKNRDYGTDRANEMIAQGVFITGSKELCDTFDYQNRLSGSAAYNYIQKIKNHPTSKVKEHLDQRKFLCRFLINWEKRKKDMVADVGMDMPEIYVLLYFYDIEEGIGSKFYREVMKRSYQSSTTKIKLAFGSLQIRGYLYKSGDGRGARLRITDLGKDVINRILVKYAVNC